MPRRSSRSRRSSRRSSRSSRRPRAAVRLRLARASEASLPSDAREFSVKVAAGRNREARSASKAFVACATLGKVTKCVTSHSFGRAVGSALREVGSKKATTKTAFGGLGGTRRRRRRR
jgi:TRAP-type uncharacterized transport system fused permease subunit